MSIKNDLKMTDVIKRNILDIIRQEGVTDFAYKDTKGIITVGAGLNVNTLDKYLSLNWMCENVKTKPTVDDIQNDYYVIQSAPTGNYHASFYKKFTCLRLSQDDVYHQMFRHLQKDIHYICKIIPNFDILPNELQDVIVDIQYNTGHIERFPKFLQAIRDKNIPNLIKESHRKDVSEKRNSDMARKILKMNDWN